MLPAVPVLVVDCQAWTPARVATAIEALALQCAHAVRRARWLTALVESTVAFREPPATGARLLVVCDGEIVRREPFEPDSPPPVPEFHRRGRAERHAGFTIARFDRLRVLTTELKRLVSKGHPVCVRLAPRAALSGERLARVLGWL